MDAFTSSGNYLGTNRIGRPLTDAEKRQLHKVLLENGYRQASAIALRFALKKAKNKARAEDLFGRANLRLVRTGWDPNAVTLLKRLLRLVWSEFTNAKHEEKVSRGAEEEFLREEGIQAEPPPATPARGDPLRPKSKEPAAASIEHKAISLEERQAELAEARKRYAELRARLSAKKDADSLEYLEHREQGRDEPKKMAEKSGRDVKVYYEAARRVHRMVERILAEKNGVAGGDEENE